MRLVSSPTSIMASIVNDVVSSIWTPGTNPGLITAMNASFYGLFATLFALILATNFNLHVVALLGVSIALFASIKWSATRYCIPALPSI